VRTLFRMPDLLSFGLGGGTLVDVERRTIGPRSLGHRLTSDALVFGGGVLTATDVGVRAGMATIGDASNVQPIEEDLADWFVAEVRRVMEEGVDRMKPDAQEIPLLAVGGGAFLIPNQMRGISEVLHVPHAAVANAVGAAIAHVSGEIDQVFSGMSREEALRIAESGARGRAEETGADPSMLDVVDVEDLPLAYLPGDARRVRVKVVGDVRTRTSS
jgi:N-methylhydantoinase A/oxoprolinase/acetone carboxylase beta subunit